MPFAPAEAHRRHDSGAALIAGLIGLGLGAVAGNAFTGRADQYEPIHSQPSYGPPPGYRYGPAYAAPPPVLYAPPSVIYAHRHIQMIQAKGRLGWQKAVGYGRRSQAEMVCLQTISSA